MRTTDYGRSWTNFAEGKGMEGYALSYVQDPVTENLEFVGTEFGLYVSIDKGETWTKWTNGYPTVPTYDMVIHPREHDLVIGTFGRSFWVLDDLRPLRELARNGTDELEKNIKVFPAPDAYLAEWREAAGTRFAADGMYAGDNRPEGARFTYSVNKEALQDEDAEEDTTKTGEDDKVLIEIFDTSGKKIRTLEVTPEYDGINRTNWELEHKGVRNPSREKPRPDAPEPGGGDVLPGTYKVKFTFAGQSDSTTVRVLADPRIEMSLSSLRATNSLRSEVDTLRSRLADATLNLAEAKDIVAFNEKLVENDNRDKESLQAVIDANEETKEAITHLQDRVFGEEDDRQGITSNPNITVMDRLYTPYRYLGDDYDGPGARERNLVRLAREAVNGAIADINRFFEEEWPAYRQIVVNAELSPFKEFEPVEF
jgi:hypothetical protein